MTLKPIRPEDEAQNTLTQERLNRDMAYLVMQIDRAVVRRSPKVTVRTAALVSLMETISLSTQVAKEQKRRRTQGFWRTIVEYLRNST